MLTIIALILVVPVILIPVVFIWYINVAGIGLVIKELAAKRAKKRNLLVEA